MGLILVIILLVYFLGDISEHRLLNQYLCLIAQTHTAAGCLTAIKAVEDMHLAKTYTRHTIHTPFVPPAAVECGAQMASVLCLRITAAPEAGEAVVIRATRATGFRFLEITEATPTDGYLIRGVLAVEVAIYSILKVAMIHPDAGGAIYAEVISAIAVVSASTLKGEVAQNQIRRAGFKIENALRRGVTLRADQFGARHTQQGLVMGLD